MKQRREPQHHARIHALLRQLSPNTRAGLARGETGLYAREDLAIMEELLRLGAVETRVVQRPTRYTGPMNVLVWVPTSRARDRIGRDPRAGKNADLIAWYRANGDRNMGAGFRNEKVAWLSRANRVDAVAAMRRLGYRGPS